MQESLPTVADYVRQLDLAQKSSFGLPLADRREELLAQALRTIASDCGVELKEPLHIDSRGEVSVVAQSGQYGEAFAAWLSDYPRRTGLAPTSCAVLPESNWCYINHFNLERLVRAYAADMPMVQEGEGCYYKVPMNEARLWMSDVELQQMLENQFGMSAIVGGWGFEAKDHLSGTAPAVTFEHEDKAHAWAKALNELYGALVSVPFEVEAKPYHYTYGHSGQSPCAMPRPRG